MAAAKKRSTKTTKGSTKAPTKRPTPRVPAKKRTPQSPAAKTKIESVAEVKSSDANAEPIEPDGIADSTDVSSEPQRANWQFWWERGFVRLWQAAMLSLSYEPSIANRDSLQAKNENDYNIYVRRKNALEMLYGHHDLVREFKHHRDGRAVRNRYISWSNFVKLADEKKWGDFSKCIDEVDDASQWTATASVDEADDKTDKELEKSRTIVIGSLLDVFERNLRGEQFEIDDGKKRKKVLVKGKQENLNLSDLAMLMIKAVGKRAEQERGFSFHNVHKQLTKASEAFAKSRNQRP
ncbi:MAG: hypothetical protein EAZ43_09305 [Betaproteobacteria bacterium]|nr:MAG: hypothetical protein EAZ43_09305 [Betaproteobacteria bacterium]